MTRYHEALASTSEAHEEISARCETVLNTTMAEMGTYHSQKIEDFETLTKEHLDEEIQLYEQVRRVIVPPMATFVYLTGLIRYC